MDKNRLETLIDRLLTGAMKTRYGQVTLSFRLHEGRIMDTTYTVTESTRERESPQNPLFNETGKVGS